MLSFMRRRVRDLCAFHQVEYSFRSRVVEVPVYLLEFALSVHDIVNPFIIDMTLLPHDRS